MISSRKLNIKEMYKLHGLLKKKGQTSKGILIEEMESILEQITPENYVNSLRLLYGDKIDIKSLSPATSISLLIDGLTKNKFFDFSNILAGFIV